MTTPQQSSRRAVYAVASLLLIAVGALLALHALLAAVIGVATGLLALGAWALRTQVLRDEGSSFRGAVALLGIAVCAMVLLPGLMLLPWALAVLACVASVSALRGAVAGTLRDRMFAGFVIAASALGVALAFFWPDLAVVVVGLVFAVGLIVFGIRLALRTFRSPREPSGAEPSTARIVALATVAVFFAAATAGSFVLRSTVSAPSDFYSWDGELPAPGTVLRTQPYDGDVPAAASALRVLYVTTHADGTRAPASAVAAYPSSPAPEGGRQVLAWQHGTTGVGRACAPSLKDDALSETAIPGIGRALERGWAVIATDYPGQGTGGRYPYLIGQGEGRAALDAVRAATRLPDAHASNRAMLWGHSQGGHATLWAAQLAAEYAPDLSITGVAALSAASDPLKLARFVTGGSPSPVRALASAYVMMPYADEYPDIDPSRYVSPGGMAVARGFAQRCATDLTSAVSLLSAWIGSPTAPLFRIDLESGPLRDRLAQNAATGAATAPQFYGQGIDDEVVPIASQRALTEKVCSAGQPLESHEYPGRDHMGVIAADSPLIGDLFRWADAVSGGGQPTNCSQPS